MDTSKIREAFLNAPDKQEDIPVPEWLVPFVDQDTQLALKDVPGEEISLLQKQARKDPAQGDLQFGASIIIATLIDKATGTRVFQPADRDALIKLGSTKLTPLASQVSAFLGFQPVQAKKEG